MSKKPYPSDIADRFIVRLPEGMRERLKDEAAKNGRSMNSEIVSRLEMTLNGGEDPDVPHALRLLREQNRIILDLIDEAGIKISRKLRRGYEELAAPPDEDPSD
ncbi:Arc family DNA-binding protein [Devosia sp. Naph2]|uniref:Arc family DNA-binding protein n=1 Tax=Devosia polycyclovorans TaxID=3345148 RepID=UPI0035D07898